MNSKLFSTKCGGCKLLVIARASKFARFGDISDSDEAASRRNEL